MSIYVVLNHRTEYHYDREVSLGPQVVRLRPAPHCRTRIHSYSLRISPQKQFLNWQQDPQSNYLARLVFPEKTRALTIEVDLVAEMSVINPFDFFLEPSAEHFPFKYDAVLAHELEPFHFKTPSAPCFDTLLQKVKKDLLGDNARHLETLETELPSGIHPVSDPLHRGRTASDAVTPGEPEKVEETRPRSIHFLVALNQLVNREIQYIVRLEPGVQTPEETLKRGKGSCRDSAWLLCQLLRHLGLASRFVSGYLIQLAPDIKSLDGPVGPSQDFTDLHAWCEVYLPGAGWVGLDPTSGLLAGEGHIPLAATPDPQSAAPITGGVDPCEVKFSFHMEVKRLRETPRVTKPYTEEQWAKIASLGHQVDQDLVSHDVRLTMGGEPTFVSIDDPDGEEWNTTALGPNKRRLADDLMRRLRKRFTSGALLHYGQGKWYPGESLPRWSFACYWRKDGEPIWENEKLLSLEAHHLGHTEKHASQFIRLLARNLNCEDQWILPAYEDTWYYLWKERRLPTNVDPFDSKLQNAEERARLARIFEQGLDHRVGYLLPLRAEPGPTQVHWVSGPWFLRSERCYLIPGDSPMGLRLPLDSTPWISAADLPRDYPIDPTVPRSPLPPRSTWLQIRPYEPSSTAPSRSTLGLRPGQDQREALEGQRTDPPSKSFHPIPRAGQSAGWTIRTALCVEPRQGRLHVFMPPVSTLEAYLSCVTAVEKTAAELQYPVVIEGYPPPHDPRIQVIKVTPDPGVIEVNIHPSSTWDQLVDRTEAIYEEARLSRLGTEKFMLDGRHTGTGGGNHIVLGGECPSDSPFLRRPDLLRSLLTFWQNHPSLSFLFSGMFIGPTSQSPRIDEARNESLYELELAFRQIPPHTASHPPPWLVDRIFRNLLVDATGNTHRAEFCIDKLFAPESSSGRLGLVEMRAFEMPPHARMSLAQQLLLRTLIARFWKTPYTAPLARWGTEIHDKWMLPHFIWNDLGEVLVDLKNHGYAMDHEWFAPHLEFRCPLVGDLDIANLRLEIRQALEPWHVLGEEPEPGGTVRYVDSSLERLEVKVIGMTDRRHVICAGGRTLPLHPTGVRGEYVAGVRYRAWQPPNCLQPTIGIHSPLVFDIVDTWNQHSVGGCTYHVVHPGGRNHTTLPVNSYEAESRRLARFFRHGHTPGPMIPNPSTPNPDYPRTLDMRQG